MSSGLLRTNLRYHDLGHGAGAIIWWVDNNCKLKIHVSNGKECHHEMNRRMNMDLRWRGRMEPSTKRVSLLPPIGIKTREDDGETLIDLPKPLMDGLKKLGGRWFWCVVKDRLWQVFEGEELWTKEEKRERQKVVSKVAGCWRVSC